MEILFENKYTRDKEWAKDIYSYISFRRPIIIVIDILFALYAIIGIYNSIVTHSIDWYHILVPIIWCIFVVLIYVRNVKTVIKRDLELHGRAVEVTVIVTDDIIKQLQSTGSEFQLNYCDIKKVVQTKKYIYLWSKTNMLYSFKKDSFIRGNLEEFLCFLEKKGIKNKNYKTLKISIALITVLAILITAFGFFNANTVYINDYNNSVTQSQITFDKKGNLLTWEMESHAYYPIEDELELQYDLCSLYLMLNDYDGCEVTLNENDGVIDFSLIVDFKKTNKDIYEVIDFSTNENDYIKSIKDGEYTIKKFKELFWGIKVPIGYVK